MRVGTLADVRTLDDPQLPDGTGPIQARRPQGFERYSLFQS